MESEQFRSCEEFLYHFVHCPTLVINKPYPGNGPFVFYQRTPWYSVTLVLWLLCQKISLCIIFHFISIVYMHPTLWTPSSLAWVLLYFKSNILLASKGILDRRLARFLLFSNLKNNILFKIIFSFFWYFQTLFPILALPWTLLFSDSCRILARFQCLFSCVSPIRDEWQTLDGIIEREAAPTGEAWQKISPLICTFCRWSNRGETEMNWESNHLLTGGERRSRVRLCRISIWRWSS